ncbi:MerR family transcriptional regulator [Acetobacterium bakii]|uniref:MerR family transcriptional regulator n=1 Tax=Acetobacterium bakii TaxID=52689 RepID=A0A0L6U1E3_9FIRM|nr:MerR family transcriptional regulator [Acetobacterium bakii]KNZ42328.1 MerR family transcriptional regulator [Acetobacterium bakii]
MIYTVGEAARQLNVAASTIRYYDKEGLLPLLERSSGGMRMFRDDDMSSLKIIECLKKTGMPIKDIKHFIDSCIEGDSKIDERLAIIESQRESVNRQMEEMQKMKEMLDYKCWYYETAKAAGTCAVHDQIKPEDVPEKFHQFLNQP